ncbi:unnamed protein product [Urochloa decumbens]|uniref:Cyclopropane-fatty-acyl-phospholipid synthase n=1 Tax=Urochloa decumbens TaxID=240449 RepID=A0ABC8YAS0_9POAL
MSADDGTGRALVVDLSCMVFSPMTCPNKMKWFEELGVEKSNILSPKFWLVIREIFKFKNHARKYLEDHGRNPDQQNETLGQFIQSHAYSQLFQDAYLIPMCACIWSSAPQGILGFPALFVLSFFRDNHLLELFGRPQWLTLKGGSGSYLNKVKQELERMGCRIKTGCEVNSVSRFNEGYGFFEDSVKAGKVAASELLKKKCDLLVNPKRMVPSWTQAGARLLVARNLDQYITIGNLRLLEEGGTTFSFGKACEKCHIKSVIRVHDPQFYWKVATEADLGFAYAYINGYISFVDNREGLLNFLLILLANRSERKRLSYSARKSSYLRKGWWTPLLGVTGVAFAKYVLRHASRKNSSNDFFALYLDPSMTYSYAIFKVQEESLEAAQLRKTDILIKKAKVESGHHVLEIGSGWGTLAIQLVKKTGCKYAGITLSEEQLKYSKRKVKEAGLEARFHEGIYLPRWLPAYIFPGGCLPSLGRIVSAMSNASRLCIQHLENIGDHYYPTLMHWRNNFMANRINVSAIGFDEIFIRTWEYYLTYAAASFKSRTVMDYQIVFSRPGDAKLPNFVAVP